MNTCKWCNKNTIHLDTCVDCHLTKGNKTDLEFNNKIAELATVLFNKEWPKWAAALKTLGRD